MKKRNLKKGVTLAEIVIVLAVVAVMSTMVISFSVACNAWVRQGTARHTALSSFNLVKGGIKAFADGFDSEKYVFDTDGIKLSVYEKNASEGEPAFYMEFKEGVLTGKSAEGDIAYPAENITGVSFILLESPSGSLFLKFTVYYSVPPLNDNRNPETGSYEVAAALRAAGKRQ